MTARKPAQEGPSTEAFAGRYRLGQILGSGGHGLVREAHDELQGELVAIKLLRRDFAADDKQAARFAREARALARLKSARIVRVLDAGVADGQPFLVMERLRGEDLAACLHRARVLSVEQTLLMARSILEGLVAAHAEGLIHRDMKPENVFLQAGEEPSFQGVKLVDFGLVRLESRAEGTLPLALTERGAFVGTPFYMAPEQVRGHHEVDARADLYAVGAIVFECLTGRPPHVGGTSVDVMAAIGSQDAPKLRTLKPTAPEALEAWVARALSRNPSDRFSSARDMLDALEGFALADQATRARERGVRRLRLAMFVIAFMAGWLVTLAAIAGIARWRGRPAGGSPSDPRFPPGMKSGSGPR